ncbi:type II toxin-antitoxin system VapC family toxin [Spirulina sp. CCNP1310]|uniref:type II toxin-antitoxin system VapC family toxin n=1 Tax=Spirulina sp. CCNP1310 TaxID=3110249 RepID=UPI002B21678D|nr:type II toxin-antitoxin system VapC family toxin [Spirulina sp. CCNP1310]MEA5420153.1 type II toxin-antitoxin system VapC family toxin [Spirulina sp. CCNP1310]
MLNKLLIDTSGWASLFITRDPHHSQARQEFTQATQQTRPIITSNYIISELVALLHSPLRQTRYRVFEIVNAIRNAPYIQIIHIDPTTDQAAWELCQNRPDKPWSLVDCSSFVIMEKYGIQAALTTDHHFEQAGFIRLLK